MLQKKAARKEVYALTKVLDNKNKILGSDRKRFFDLVEEVTGNTMQSLKEAMKPKDLRNFIVRIVWFPFCPLHLHCMQYINSQRS